MPVTAPTCRVLYRVTVRLDVLARHLSAPDAHGHRTLHDDFAAAKWLTRSGRDPSPFVATADFGIFDTLEDPAAILEPDEIVNVEERPVPRGASGRLLALHRRPVKRLVPAAVL